jgi:hypothetical protein
MYACERSKSCALQNKRSSELRVAAAVAANQPASRCGGVAAERAVEAGQQFGAWTVAMLDPSGKRATVICQCGTPGQVAADALLAGESRGCGCRLSPRPRGGRPISTFSSDLARDEGYAALHRHKARP